MPNKHQNDPRSAQKRPQNDQKSDPERQDEKRTEPRRSWDRLGPPRCRFAHYRCAPRSPFGRSKRHQNRSQNDQKSKRKIKTKKNDPSRSWIRLGAILGRLGCHRGALETLWHYAYRCFVKIHFFDVKTVRRRLWDQLWPNKAPK